MPYCSKKLMNDIKFMTEAILEGRKAYDIGDVPVGAVVVVDEIIVGRGYNLRHNEKNSLKHAEMMAIDDACKNLNRWILDDATIYVTVEPCLMCTGAIIQSRIKRLVYGINEPKYGCIESVLDIKKDYKFNQSLEVTKDICKDEITTLMKEFFKKLRNK